MTNQATAVLPNLDDIRAARERIGRSIVRTPLVRLNAPSGDTQIYLKLENLQPIGSFKIRGASNAMAKLPKDRLARGVLTASAGNMAQGVAWCARELGIPCTVVSPNTAPETKIAAVERLGAKVIKAPFDEWWQTFERRAYPGVDATFIHAFDDPDVMAGNGTLALEILEDLPDARAIVVPWGGGGLACGIAAGVRAQRASCRIFTAEVETGAPFAASFSAGAPQRIDYRASWVDGIASRNVFPSMFERARGVIDGALVASLAAVASALRLMAERNRIIAEGAGACPVACALAGGAGSGPVVCIVSGGNIDFAKLSTVLAGSVP